MELLSLPNTEDTTTMVTEVMKITFVREMYNKCKEPSSESSGPILKFNVNQLTLIQRFLSQLLRIEKGKVTSLNS